MGSKLAAKWQRVQRRLQGEIGEGEYLVLIRSLELQGRQQGTLTLTAPTPFRREWIRRHYTDRLLALWQQESRRVACIDIQLQTVCAAKEAGKQALPLSNKTGRGPPRKPGSQNDNLQASNNVRCRMSGSDKHDEGLGGKRKRLDNSQFVEWYRKVCKRPEKYKGERRQGYFSVDSIYASTPILTDQFPDDYLIPGDTIRMWIKVKGLKHSTGYYCFANLAIADFLETVDADDWLYGELKCLGQIKIYETTSPDPDDPERGIEYHPAWLITEAGYAQ